MSVKDEVLKELENNKGDYISGGQLADNLGVSRNSVWKAIKAFQYRTSQDLLQNHRHSQALLPAALSAVESDSLLP